MELSAVRLTEGVLQRKNHHKHEVYAKHYAPKLLPSRLRRATSLEEGGIPVIGDF